MSEESNLPAVAEPRSSAVVPAARSHSTQSRLLEALDDAVGTIRDSVADGNVDLAMKLVQGFGALHRPEPDFSAAALLVHHVAAEELREEADIQKIESRATAPGDAPQTVSSKNLG